MENATEALMMGFAVLVFVIALTVSITVFSQVRVVSDMVLYRKDETNYYEYEGATGKAAENRIVGLETIIPTLYKYYKENYTVVFREGTYNMETGEFGEDLKPLTIYNTQSKNSSLWGESYDTMMMNKYKNYFTGGYNEEKSKRIFSFDLEEETSRREPWTGSNYQTKENLQCFLNGEVYYNPNNNSDYINYNHGFIQQYNNKKFVETIGEYTYSSSQSTEDGSSIATLVKEKKKRMIIFTYITNQ